MDNDEIFKKLVYLDKGFISNFFEMSFDISPSTTITTNQGKKAGAGIFNFSAEVSAQETKSFSMSTLQMLNKSLPKLKSEGYIDINEYQRGSPSVYGWIKGALSTVHVERKQGGETLASSDHFVLRLDDGRHLDFITTPEYFSSGFDSLLKLHETLLNKFSVQVLAYVRLLPASDHQGNWIAVPLLLLEIDGKAS